MKKLLHIARKTPNPRVWTPVFIEALKEMVDLEIVADGDGMTDEACAARVRHCDVLLTCWDARRTPAFLTADRGRLEYICNITGEMGQFVPLALIEAGIPVTNWGDVPADGIAEGAMALLLATVKNLHERIQIVEQGGWRPPASVYSGTLNGMHVGIYGCGFIARRFVEMLRPFRSVMRIYDPYADGVPEGCARVDSLAALFAQSEAVVIHAGLTEETRGTVTAELLAMLPDNGIVVNTARGGIVDGDALLVELGKGRLLAGLDVIEPHRLPEGHPARRWPNAIFTAHSIGKSRPGHTPPTVLQPMHRVCLDNLRRHIEGKPLRFVMDRERYLRST